MYNKQLTVLIAATLASGLSVAGSGHGEGSHHAAVADGVIAKQRAELAHNTDDKGFGPQAPRDIDAKAGNNTVAFSMAPPAEQMNLCNIHFHKNAEHKGGEFTRYAGNGDGHGFLSGYRYSGTLSHAEKKPAAHEACPSAHGGLQSGDTIEVHYVYSSAPVTPGPTLGACLNESIKNPSLRVESQIMVLVNDGHGMDFGKLTAYGERNGRPQALNIPANMGTPVQFAGSTTGPKYNEQGSPFQVTWSVRPKVAKVNIDSVGEWCKGNVFKEDHAHGVRNLVKNPDLLSPID